MTLPADREIARALVEQIAQEHGFLGEETLSLMDPDVRRKVEEALLKKDLMIGSSVITLAKNLYTSQARFVFELLQNADDNSYSKATASGCLPYVSFHLYPHRIVLECNEDGFTSQNLAAICSVGKSSKMGAQGYIGEKGIGFKSVFMAAWKVDIQSGAFSFGFQHKVGESGMGMITPIWKDTDEELPPSLTRFTLHLHETGDSAILENLHKAIRQQFETLQESILLFMKNLQKIHIGHYDESGDQMSSVTFAIEHPENNQVALRKTITTGGVITENVKLFHVTTFRATDLPKHDSRTYSQEEEASRSYSESQVILAFPLSETSVPSIEPQDLFVFLPVRAVGFNFIIHADFVTDASRQDIVRDSLRNHRLLDGVADAFIKAVLQFCQHETLCYQWMRYLPDKDAAGWAGLWASLVYKIEDRLSKTPVMYGRKRPDLRLITSLLRLRASQLDAYGEPLLDDGNPEQLLSQGYDGKDLDILRSYGLKYASQQTFNRWLEKDLEQGSLSRMKSHATSDDWHTRVAKSLQFPFQQKDRNVSACRISELETMSLVPLEDDTWVSPHAHPVYFPKTGGLDIPSDVGLRLVSKSVTNASRQALFQYLGVRKASVCLVRERVLQSYPADNSLPRISLDASISHLRFLYLTEESKRDDESSYSRLAIQDNRGSFCRPNQHSIFCIDSAPFGAWELFKTTNSGPEPGDGAPGFSCLYVHEGYFIDPPADGPEPRGTWLEWFHDKLGVRSSVPFCDGEDRFLHPAAEYLQKYRPEKFLGALRVWNGLRPSIPYEVITHLRDTEVLCLGNRKVLLDEAYFLTKDLEKRAKAFVPDDAFFPWLWIGTDATPDAMPDDWKQLLTRLNAGFVSSDLEFALDMLAYSCDAFSKSVTREAVHQLFQLYEHIHTKFREEEKADQPEAKEKIRDLFTQSKRIYVPNPDDSYSMVSLDACVWSAPQHMESKFALKLLYSQEDDLECADGSYRAMFFKDTLGIPDCTWEDYVAELRVLKAGGCSDSDVIAGLYVALDAVRADIITVDIITAAFENDALIFASSDAGPSWHKTSQCVWSTAARIRGKVSLNDDYEDLEELFVSFLGVQRVDLQMAVDALQEIGNRQSASNEEVRESIWTVNALLQVATDSTSYSSSEEIIKCCIFPVSNPNGIITRASNAMSFFIVDREPLEAYFTAKVKLLAFSLNEVVRLRPFLLWACLEDRFLSNCVKEITSFNGYAEKVSDPDREVRNRAYSLLRIAAHFQSPRLNSTGDFAVMYSMLRNVETYETDGISSALHLSQDGVSHNVEVQRTSLHIDERESSVKIYIPREPKDQHYCFTQLLPKRLFEWIMTTAGTHISRNVSKDGVSATKDIFVASRSRISAALQEDGIATIELESLDDEDLSESAPPTMPTTPTRATGASSPALSVPSDREDSESVASDSSDTSKDPPSASGWSSNALSSRTSSLQPAPAHHLAHGQHVAEHHTYVALLGKVIALARSAVTGSNVFHMGTWQRNLTSFDGGQPFSLHGTGQSEKYWKLIGAAGELFVFEILSNLRSRLPGFTRGNWQSTIRKYVTVHPDYVNMDPWTGRETSDITYADGEGVLTNLFIEEDCLPGDVCTGRTPNYFIEVKTTTSSCNTPFYVSKAQYRRMQDNVLRPGNLDSVYVIFRVYNLGRDNMALKVYMDPESLRVEEQLRFTAETWSIVPSTGA